MSKLYKQSSVMAVYKDHMGDGVNPRTKTQVRILEAVSRGYTVTKALCDKYSVSSAVIHSIVRGESYESYIN